MTSENPYQSLFWDMVRAAQKAGASDIHIQPWNGGVEIRFRIFGDLKAWKWVDEVHQTAFLQESKRLSQCSLGICGKAQDSRFRVPDLSLDIRVSLVPSLYGEKLVLRLLDQKRLFTLEEVGLDYAAYCAIKSALDTTTGVVLITGPTGSGKTTLLYSAICSLDQARANIVTIEDPVEYSLEAFTQIQVSPRFSMNDALRAVLRQDPDIILLGEIRDAESAALCFQAASTGHLVLSTLHANSAKGASDRLATLGVDRDLISTCLRFTSAQRLLPKLCPSCRMPSRDSELESKGRFYHRNTEGCPTCRSGAIGRVPVFEFVNWKGKDKADPVHSPSLAELAMASAMKGEVDVYDALRME